MKHTLSARIVRHSRLAVVALLCALSSAASAQPAAAKKPAAAGYPPTIVFMTDFGVVDDSVAICRGVMYTIMPSVRIVDLSHEVTPFSILDGARFLFGASPYYPAGAVFVTVIDPGVGSTRKAIVARTKRGQYFVLPDNGLMTLVEQRDGIAAARQITNTQWMIGNKLSSTFHGRDIFSPVAAHLARGEDWTAVGPEVAVKDLVRLNLQAATLDLHGISGEVIATDGPYGNLVTNIDAELFQQMGYQLGQQVTVRINDQDTKVTLARTFSDVPLNQPLLYIDSRGHMALAINQGNFAATYNVKPPAKIFIPRSGK
jgi:S-adenosyl-L-methionine hydrolase (adenosine-forming)